MNHSEPRTAPIILLSYPVTTVFKMGIICGMPGDFHKLCLMMALKCMVIGPDLIEKRNQILQGI